MCLVEYSNYQWGTFIYFVTFRSAQINFDYFLHFTNDRIKTLEGKFSSRSGN